MLSQIYGAIQKHISFPEYDLELKADLTPEELAAYVREKWQLGDKPIYNLIDIMERHGIIISNAFEGNSNIDAYSHVEFIEHKVVPIVILGYEKNVFRQQFNAAHELGHILTDGYYELEKLSKAEYRDMEKYMNHFACALLIPKSMLARDLQGNAKTDIRYYIELKKRYRVSAQALIVRACQIGAITNNQYQYLMKQISQNNFRLKEPYDDSFPLIFPRYLKQAMLMIKKDKGISGSEFMDILKDMRISLHTVMVEDLLNLDRGFLNDDNRKTDIVLDFK